jgi:putative ABC transport system permease protein
MLAVLEVLSEHRLRSALTLLSLAGGVLGVMAIGGYARYADAQLAAGLAQLGSNRLSIVAAPPVLSGARVGRLQSLTVRDLDAIETEVPNVVAAGAFKRVGNLKIVAGRLDWTTTVQGVSVNYGSLQAIPIGAGRFLTPNETDAPAIVLGSSVARRLFPSGDAVGQTVRIGSTTFEVLGVLGERGRNAILDFDDIAYVPLDVLLRRLAGGTSLDGITVRIDAREHVPAAIAAITDVLRRTHRPLADGRDDFQVQNDQLVADRAREGAQALGRALDAAAGLGLLIGGFGVLNLMLVSVGERTHEIGIRLAVGARTRDVFRQFLLESATLSCVGAGVGLALGLSGAIVVAWRLQIDVLPSWQTDVLAVGAVAATSIAFGSYPARRAARLDPIEVLRQE